MRKLLIIVSLFISVALSAQGSRDTVGRWSFYGNFGAGISTPVTLEGLAISYTDMQYFKTRGVKPSFYTTGTSKAVPVFNIGASYDFKTFRVSLDMGSQYVNQTNYHAPNFNLDALFGYVRVFGNFEASANLGLGFYALRNDYYYNWKGVDQYGNLLYQNEVPEMKTVYLGEHNVNTLSVPAKIEGLYNLTDSHWLGLFVHGRYNIASDSFCPKFAFSAGIEYRYTLGRKKAAASVKCPRSNRMFGCPMMCAGPWMCSRRGMFGSYVYSPIYIIANAGETVRIETADGVKIETSTPDGQVMTSTINSSESPVTVISTPTTDILGDTAEEVVRVLFEKGSSDITNTASEILDNINLNDVNVISITAYTCSSGSDKSNKVLGDSRLRAVEKYLRDKGFEGTFISSYQHGDVPDPDWRAVSLKIVR